MEYVLEKRFPVNSNDYKLYEEVGEGVSATVYRALCIPLNEIVAIKVLDLERCNNDLDGIRREVQTMTLIDHPNVLQAHCSFVTEKDLWVVMPYMSGGSCLHIMKSAYSEGFEETVIATILREVLKALAYLHSHGHIHRDVKAGNILVDYNGAVKLADFGVSACMFDTGDRQRSRNTFVGTPCWMAPEVMQQLHGYDFKADVWSFGITALELAHGHAPFSKYPPMKVLLMTLQNAPPGLDYERDKRFSKSFKEMVSACLVKDPKKRPTSEKLLKHSFFKHARSYEYLARSILDGLPPLGDRFRTLKAKEANLLMQNKGIHGDKEHLSQQEYIRGISAWNFNLEDLKAQATLIPDDDEISNVEKLDPKFPSMEITNVGFAPNGQSPESIDNSYNAVALEDLQHTGGSLASFPAQSLQALKDCFDVCDDDLMPCNPNQQSEEQDSKENDREKTKSNSSLSPKVINPEEPQMFLSGSLLPDKVLFLSKRVSGDADRDNLQLRPQSDRNYSGPLLNRQKKDINNSTQGNMYPLEDTSEGTLVQRKGRFKVTSADLSPKCGPTPTFFANQAMGTTPTATVAAASILPSLQYILQQNAMQRDQIMKLIKCFEQTSGLNAEFSDIGIDVSQFSPVSTRERELQSKVFHLQQSYVSLSEELQRVKLKNAQLERQISTLNKESKVS